MMRTVQRHCFGQPSKNESFSFVIMESWLCRRPVLVHEGCAVTKNFVSCCNGGLYFGNYYDFQETVKYILNHPDTLISWQRTDTTMCVIILPGISWWKNISAFLKN